MLTRDDILKTNDLPIEAVDVPEWGGTVYVRTISGRERDDFEESMLTGKGKNRQVNTRNIRAKLCALCLCDVNGVPLFGNEDVDALGQKSAAALDRLFTVATRLNGISKEDVEELAKNSPSAPHGDSTSD
jgi:hypothetical protein